MKTGLALLASFFFLLWVTTRQAMALRESRDRLSTLCGSLERAEKRGTLDHRVSMWLDLCNDRP